MNPMSNVEGIKRLNEKELELGLAGSKNSWHNQYKESAWIFVGGLPFDLTEGDVLSVFSQFGEVVNINMVRDKETGKTKGYCFICYEDQRSTILTVDNLNGIKLLGRTLRVDHVKDYKVPKEQDNEDEVTSKLRAEGCAPKVASSSEEEQDSYDIPVKKEKITKMDKKKKKKEKKKKKRDTSSDSSDDQKQTKRKKQNASLSKDEGKKCANKIVEKIFKSKSRRRDSSSSEDQNNITGQKSNGKGHSSHNDEPIREQRNESGRSGRDNENKYRNADDRYIDRHSHKREYSDRFRDRHDREPEHHGEREYHKSDEGRSRERDYDRDRSSTFSREYDRNKDWQTDRHRGDRNRDYYRSRDRNERR